MAMRDLIKHGSVGPLYSAGHEIVRRIFVSVRDRHWNEIAPAQWESHVDSTRGVIALSARHRSERVDFEWHGELAIDADARTIQFSFDGTARASMEVCRLGLIVLLPVETMIGSRVTAHDAQSMQRLTVPARISPQPIVDGVPIALTEPFSEIEIERADLGVLTLRFQGDLFELEDQRNWGDASFKLYCTPLRLGYPRAVEAGTRVRHSVAMRFEPATGDTKVSRLQSLLPADATGAPTRFPHMGLEWTGGSSPAILQVRKSSFCYFHIDATASGSDEALRVFVANNESARLEIGVHAPEQGALSDRQLALIQQSIARLARVLVYGVGTSTPSGSAIETWQRVLREANGPHIPVLGATQGYYVEFNRSLSNCEPAQGIAFPLTATVHSDEAATIVENVGTVFDMAETVRNLIRAPELAVVPLALYYPTTPPAMNFPPQLILPWAVATVMHAALAGISSVTVAAQLLARIGTTGADILEQLAACAGREVQPIKGSQAVGVHAMVLGASPTLSAQILVTNLTDRPQRFAAPSLATRATRCTEAISRAPLVIEGDEVHLPGSSVVWIDLQP